MQKMDVKHTKQTITDEELEQFNDFFEEAVARIEKKERKDTAVLDLANKMKNTGYTEFKICNAIIKKFNIIKSETGKKHVDGDYIRKILPDSMKDYVHGKKSVIKIKEKKTSEELSRERKKTIDKTIKKAIEIGKEKGYDLGTTEIEIPDMVDDSENTVELEPSPIVESGKVKDLEEEISDLKAQIVNLKTGNANLVHERDNIISRTNQLTVDYNDLLKKYNWISKPYMERRWTIVKTPNPDGGEPLITVVESDAVANPLMKRINIPGDTKNKQFSRSIPFEELAAHKKEWEELTKGKKYLDVAVKSKTQEKETQE